MNVIASPIKSSSDSPKRRTGKTKRQRRYVGGFFQKIILGRQRRGRFSGVLNPCPQMTGNVGDSVGWDFCDEGGLAMGSPSVGRVRRISYLTCAGCGLYPRCVHQRPPDPPCSPTNDKNQLRPPPAPGSSNFSASTPPLTAPQQNPRHILPPHFHPIQQAGLQRPLHDQRNKVKEQHFFPPQTPTACGTRRISLPRLQPRAERGEFPSPDSNRVRNKVKELLGTQRDVAIASRRKKLSALLYKERDGYEAELAEMMRPDPEKGKKAMAARAYELKSRREAERSQLVKEKLYQQWREGIDELRAQDAKLFELQVTFERGVQSEEKAERERQERREDAVGEESVDCRKRVMLWGQERRL